MNVKLEDLCLSLMETALAFYDAFLNANISTNPDEAMQAIDAEKWSKSMQLELNALNEWGVWVMVKDGGQYYHETKWVYNVNVAFPYADLEEVIHIKPPIGVNVPHGYVLRLHKALYGMKQAPRAWYQLMTSMLLNFGFTMCVPDPCTFFYKVGTKIIIVGVYVDDILISENSRALINEVKRYIEEHFQIKVLGSVKTMLGINISHNIAYGLLTTD
jgi:Reverse transcriptase (RNA-dependent DNA polymerase)